MCVSKLFKLPAELICRSTTGSATGVPSISAYCVTITLMNAAAGLATGIAMRLTRLDDPLLWGVTAFLLNCVPIMGPLPGVGIFCWPASW